MVNGYDGSAFGNVHPVHHTTLRTAREKRPRLLHELPHHHNRRNHHRHRKEISRSYLTLSLAFNVLHETPIPQRFPERVSGGSSREGDGLENHAANDVAVSCGELYDVAYFFIVITAHQRINQDYLDVMLAANFNCLHLNVEELLASDFLVEFVVETVKLQINNV